MTMSNGVTGGVFSSLEDLQASKPRVNTRVQCIERGNAEYIVRQSDHISLAGDITFSNGLVGELQPNGPWWNIKLFGASVDASDNADAFDDAISRAGDSPVVADTGVYNVSRTILWSTHGSGIKSTSSGYVEIRVNSGDVTAVKFSPNNPELGDLLREIKVDGLSVSCTDTSSSSYLVELNALEAPVINNLRVFGRTKCLEIKGIKDANFSNWLMFASNGGNSYDGSSLVKIGGYPLSAGGYTQAWTTNISNFISSTNGLCDHFLDISQCDGIQIVNGYWGRTKVSHLNLQPNDNNIGISKLVVSNVYMDGINTIDGSESCLTIPSTAFTGTHIAESKLVGCSLSNCTGDIVNIEGQVNNLSIVGSTISNSTGKAINWSGGGSAQLSSCDIKNNTGVTVSGAKSFTCSSMFEWISSNAVTLSGVDSAAINNNSFQSISGININKSNVNSFKAIGNTGDSGDIPDDFGNGGSFIPALYIGGSGAGIVYHAQIGRYQRVGSYVMFSITIKISSKGGLTGNLFIGGLPIDTQDDESASCEVRGLSGAFSPSSTQALVLSSGVSISYLSSGVRTDLTGNDISDSAEFRVSGSYYAA